MKQDLKTDIEDLIAAGVADDLSSEEIAGNVLSAIEVEAVLARSPAQDAGACEHCDFVAWRWRWGEKDFWKYTDLNGPGIPSTAYQVEPLYTDGGSSLRTPAEGEEQDELGLRDLGESFLAEYERAVKDGCLKDFVCAESPVEVLWHLINEVDEIERLFDLQGEADRRAVAAWKEAHPDKPLTSPDRCDMVVWLMEEFAKVRAERDLAVSQVENMRASLNLAYVELKQHAADYHHRTSTEVNNKIVDALGLSVTSTMREGGQ